LLSVITCIQSLFINQTADRDRQITKMIKCESYTKPKATKCDISHTIYSCHCA